MVQTNVFLLYIMDGINGDSFGACLVGVERVIKCWSDGMDVSLRMCIATEFCREYTTPSTLLIIIMDVIGHIRESSECTFQQDASGGRCLLIWLVQHQLVVLGSY